MAGYARRDAVRAERLRHEQMRRLRTARDRRGAVRSMSWAMEGTITLDRYFLPALVTIDPLGEGYHAEYKQIIAVDGFLREGVVTIDWKHNEGYFYLGHEVSGDTARVVFDGLEGRPEPYIISNGAFGGEFLQPEITEEPPFASQNMTCIAIIETVPL